MVSTHIKTFIILGPTSSGKSECAHRLFHHLNSLGKKSALINLDAFQIYQDITAGTAKPSLNEIEQYDYRCVNLCLANENMDAQSFTKLAHTEQNNILNNNKIPIAVGGSGLYLRAFLHGLDELPPRNEDFRKQLKELANQHGWPWCHRYLTEVDPVRAQEVHPNDKTRIERALEIYFSTGQSMSSLRSKTTRLHEQSTLFNCQVIHIELNEDDLKQRMRKRTEALFKQGWIKEIQQLKKNYGDSLKNFHAMQAIGYREILKNLEEKPINEAHLIERIYTLTWQYAKRQLTWNAKEKKDLILRGHNAEHYETLWESLNM